MGVLTRYLTRLFSVRFILLLIGIAIFVLSLDLMTNAKKIMAKENGELLAVAKYAILRLPQILSEINKFACLLASLLTLTSLIRHNQLAPILSAGISQFGILQRLIPMAVLVGALQFGVSNGLAPDTNAMLRDWNVIPQGAVSRSRANLAISATWIRVGKDVVRIPNGAIGRLPLKNITIFERDGKGQLAARLDVAEAGHDGTSWTLIGVTRRQVDGEISTIDRILGWGAALKLAHLGQLIIHPRDLSFLQLLRFINAEAHGSWAPHLYQTWLQVKLATCFVPFLLIFLIIALSQRFQRTGHIEFLFVSGVALGFAFFIFNGVGLAMGEVGMVPPLVAGWAATAGFAALGGAIAFWHEVYKPRAFVADAEAS